MLSRLCVGCQCTHDVYSCVSDFLLLFFLLEFCANSAFFTNGFRGGVFPCMFVAGSPQYEIDPLAGHPAINKWYRFNCIGKGASVESFTVTFYMSLVILILHCLILPVLVVVWLYCNRSHIVHYDSTQHFGEGDLIPLPSVQVKKLPGTVISFKFL